MKLSTRMRYGARAMLELAQKYDDGVVSSREIATQQQISLKYLEHLMTSLRVARLVRSVRGAQGGHTLARSPDQINLREIYDALEGPDGFVACTSCPQVCDRTSDCVTREVWAQMHASCMGLLESTSLEELVRRAREKQATQPITHHI